MKQNSKQILAALVASAATVVSANAGPVQWSGIGANGHWYDVISAPQITWDDANAADKDGGYLATILSSGENAFVNDLVVGVFGAGGYPNNPGQAWLGGKVGDPVKIGEKSTYKVTWVHSDPCTYLNWASGEPNNAGGIEKLGITINRFGDGTWNDEGSWMAGIRGYVVEWDKDPNRVPDGGATLVLLGLGLGVCGLVARRK